MLDVNTRRITKPGPVICVVCFQNASIGKKHVVPIYFEVLTLALGSLVSGTCRRFAAVRNCRRLGFSFCCTVGRWRLFVVGHVAVAAVTCCPSSRRFAWRIGHQTC